MFTNEEKKRFLNLIENTTKNVGVNRWNLVEEHRARKALHAHFEEEFLIALQWQSAEVVLKEQDFHVKMKVLREVAQQELGDLFKVELEYRPDPCVVISWGQVPKSSESV